MVMEAIVKEDGEQFVANLEIWKPAASDVNCTVGCDGVDRSLNVATVWRHIDRIRLVGHQPYTIDVDCMFDHILDIESARQDRPVVRLELISDNTDVVRCEIPNGKPVSVQNECVAAEV